MEQRNSVRTVKFVLDDDLENPRQEIRITTDERMAEKRLAQVELEPRDVSYSCNDARFLIEMKKRRRSAAEFATGIENMTPGAQLEEEREPRSSPIVVLRSETKKLTSRKRNTQGCNHCGSLDHFAPECDILPEDLLCSFCKKMGHVESVCFLAHPERLKNPKPAKHQHHVQYAPLQTCNHCGSQFHVTSECEILAEDLYCSFCGKMGHLEEECFQAHPERGRNLKRAKHHQQVEYAPVETCNRCGSPDHVSRECSIPTKDLHCSFCNRAGHVKSVCFEVHPERAKNQQNREYRTRLRDSALVAAQGREMRKKNTEVDEEEGEFVAIVASLRAENRKLEAERDELQRETDATISSLASANARRKSELDELKGEIEHQTLSNSRLRSELEDARGVVQDAQTKLDAVRTSFSLLVEKNKELEMQKQEAKSAVQEEKLSSKLRFAEIIERKSLEDDAKKRQYLASAKSLQADKQKLTAELDEQKQMGCALVQSLTSERTNLRNDLDAARIAIQDGRAECDNKLAIVLSKNENVEKKLALVMVEANVTLVALTEQKAQVAKLEAELATALTKIENLEKELDFIDARGAKQVELDRQTAQVTKERDDKLKMHKTRTDLMSQKEKLECDVSLIQQEAAEDKRNLVQALKDLDECKTHVVQLEEELKRLREEGSALTKLEYDTIPPKENAAQDKRKLVRPHKNELDEAITDVVNLERALRSLAEEQSLREKLEYDANQMCEEAAEDRRKLVEAQNELAKARTVTARLETELESLRKERHRTEREYDVDLIREEEGKAKRKLAQAHKHEMDKAKTHISYLENEVRSLTGLQYNFNLVVQEEKDAYKRELRLAKDDLEDARDTVDAFQREIVYLREHRNRQEKLEYDVDLLRKEEAKEKRKLVEAHRIELGEASTDIARLKTELQSLESEKNRLESAHQAIKKNLEDEKERSLCQICMEVPKDTISFPCLHLHYCFSCLDTHKKQNNSCPSCRTPISGLLKSDILI